MSKEEIINELKEIAENGAHNRLKDFFISTMLHKEVRDNTSDSQVLDVQRLIWILEETSKLDV